MFFAPFDIVLSEFNVVEPDLVYFGPEAAQRIKPREHVRFPPDLAIDVLSPSTARIDRGRKRDLLARYGLREYWVVDPDRRVIEVSILQGSGDREAIAIRAGRYESATQPGLAIDLDELFTGIE